MKNKKKKEREIYFFISAYNKLLYNSELKKNARGRGQVSMKKKKRDIKKKEKEEKKQIWGMQK